MTDRTPGITACGYLEFWSGDLLSPPGEDALPLAGRKAIEAERAAARDVAFSHRPVTLELLATVLDCLARSLPQAAPHKTEPDRPTSGRPADEPR